MKRIISLLIVMFLLLPSAAPVLAYELEPGELPGATVEIYPDDLPVFLIETGITITSQPVDYQGKVGGTAVFKVVATGDITSYQWSYSKNGGESWFTVNSFEGATSSILRVPITEARNNFIYRCRLSNSFGSVFSDGATLIV